MGKMKIDIYCYLVADILQKFFQKCLLSSPLANIYFLSKLLKKSSPQKPFFVQTHTFIGHKADKADTFQKCS